MTEIERPLEERRKPLHPDITEDLIAEVVYCFYSKVKDDDLIGPVFADIIGTTDEDWKRHLPHMCAFWSSILLMSGRFKGSPMQKHAVELRIQPHHFPRWLALFEETVREICPPDIADIFMSKANNMSVALQGAMKTYREAGGATRVS